ncbi:hypothetical protein ACJ73_03665 [Blastomyces percursus]|uniref:Uncharacterized protein n=1 Tax=Blastomyces percursus TaxID=1658174 RepID=A0A1J9R8Z1_9EURO|nr:hypothetical protein ACJ73_03665 [Blastomyces percursus]
MTCLHIPGIPTRPNDKAARKHNGPAFTTFPHRVTYKKQAPPLATLLLSSPALVLKLVRLPAPVPLSLLRDSPLFRNRSPFVPLALLRRYRPLLPSLALSLSPVPVPERAMPQFPVPDMPLVSSPPRPSGPIPWSRDSTLSRPQSLCNSTRFHPPARPIPSSAYSTLSKLPHVRCSRPTSATSTRSSPAPPTHSVPYIAARSSPGTSIRSDSFPSTRCFIAAALKAITIRSSPATTSPHVSTSSSARSSSTTSIRSGSLLSSPSPPPVRFNCADDRLEAVRQVVRRHRREHAQLCSGSSSASKAVSSSHGSDNSSARARTSCRRNVKPVKLVKFGGVTVHEIDTWIKPGIHTQRDPTKIVGKLVGWSVTPLKKLEDDEDCKYTTYSRGQVSQLTHAHLPGKPCGRSFCSWNDLANIRRDLCKVARLDPDNPYKSIRTRLVFEEFNRSREKIREHGHFLL